MTTKVRVLGAVPGVGKQSFLILRQIKPRNWTEIKDFCWCTECKILSELLADKIDGSVMLENADRKELKGKILC